MRHLTGSRLRSVLGSARRSRWDWLAVVPAAMVAFAMAAVVLPPRSGPLALVLVLEAQLFIAAFAILAPIALLARARLLGVALLLVLVAGGPLFASEWISLPGSGAARHDLKVMSWNVQYGMRTPAEQAAQLAGVDADVIALLEVEPDASAAVEADPVLATRYPYRAMAPRIGPWGLAVLSRYPISETRSGLAPAFLEMDVAAPRGPVHLIVGHPMHAAIRTVTPLRLPVDYDPAVRDAEVAAIRQRVEAALATTGARLLLVGDFNATPSEAEYRVLARGLRDTHVEVGVGPGWTWRPSRFTFLPVAFVRIDLQLTAGPIFPASTSVDCSLPGDHCRLFGVYEID